MNYTHIEEEKMEDFKTQLTELINREGLENGSDTPDFILAEYLINCLLVYEVAIQSRTKWHGPVGTPSVTEPPCAPVKEAPCDK
jgi:hypothetical protein